MPSVQLGDIWVYKCPQTLKLWYLTPIGWFIEGDDHTSACAMWRKYSWADAMGAECLWWSNTCGTEHSWFFTRQASTSEDF